MAQTFSAWIDTFVSEKGIDPENILNVNGPSGLNVMQVANVIEAMKSAPKHERDRIKKTLILIDFKAGDPMHFIRHLAQAIAR